MREKISNLLRQISGRTLWLVCTAVAALISAALRRWQLNSAFEKNTGLAIPGAQASVILICVLMMIGAWFAIMALLRRPLPEKVRWDHVFLSAGDRVFPTLEIAAAFFAIAAAPVFFIVGVDQFQFYQEMLAAHRLNSSIQIPSNNGILALFTAGGAFLAALGLLQTGRDNLNPGRRGRGGFSIALPGVAGCIWLMESFRSHAANPVRWDYAPQLLAVVLGMAFYMDFAGMSAGLARPRRLLWMAGMTAVFSAVALSSTAAELANPGQSLLSAQLGDLLLLLSQLLAAAGVLWHLPPSLDSSETDSPGIDSPDPDVLPEPDQSPEPIQEIQEDTDDE